MGRAAMLGRWARRAWAAFLRWAIGPPQRVETDAELADRERALADAVAAEQPGADEARAVRCEPGARLVLGEVALLAIVAASLLAVHVG